jgi:hypothetical protein
VSGRKNLGVVDEHSSVGGQDVVEHQSVMHKIKPNRMVSTAYHVRQVTTSHRPVRITIQLLEGN